MPGEGNPYLQCTTMGPASGGLQVFTRLRKARNGVGYSGTPWSGHAVNWNCRTSRFSLEPFCRTRERQRQGGHQHPKAACAVCAAWATAHLQGKQEQEPAHLVKGERSDAERGQFNGVQQRHLDHSVGVRASAWPVLVTLYLQDRRDGSVLGQTLQWWEAHSQTALLQVKLGRWQRQGKVQEVSLQSTRTGTDPSQKAPTD